MTIERMFERLVEVMCDKYCRFPREHDAMKDGQELWESEICTECPLCNIEKLFQEEDKKDE